MGFPVESIKLQHLLERELAVIRLCLGFNRSTVPTRLKSLRRVRSMQFGF